MLLLVKWNTNRHQSDINCRRIGNGELIGGDAQLGNAMIGARYGEIRTLFGGKMYERHEKEYRKIIDWVKKWKA